MQDCIYYGQPVNWSHPLTRGLVGWWKVLPWWSSGPRLIDLCNKSHGVLTGGPTWAAGRPGLGALSFDGSNDYIDFGTSAIYEPTLLTTSFWIKNPAQVAYERLLSKTIDPAWNVGWGFWFGSETGGGTDDLNFWRGVYNSNKATFDFAGWGEWHHVVGVARGAGAGNLELYVDGLVRATGTDAGVTGSGNTMMFGNGSGGAYYSGLADDIAIYNRALSAAEVYALYQESRRNSPSMLSRLSSTTYSFSSGVAPVTATGDLQTTASTVAGVGSYGSPEKTATGDLQAQTTTAAGVGDYTSPVKTGTGDFQTEVATVAGEGAYTTPVKTATGDLQAQVATVAGVGAYDTPEKTATGDLQTQTVTIAGVGMISIHGTGDLQTQAARISGSGLMVPPGGLASSGPGHRYGAPGVSHRRPRHKP